MYADHMWGWEGRDGARAWMQRALILALVAAAATLAVDSAQAVAQPIEMAAPYEYLGWGDPQNPVTVMQASGVKDLTLAFMLSHGSCNPEWDGSRPLIGGVDQAAIQAIRAAGGDVVVSFGGWSGKKLGSSCKTVAALAGAYQKVIDAYSLKAIDIDIEHTEFTNKKTRARVVAALATVQSANPGIEISITLGTAETGPEKAGLSLISDAAAVGFQPTVWTLMPFDFGPAQTDMGHASTRSLEGLASVLQSDYHLSAAVAYEHVGVSSMNGHTDESSETVGLDDFQTILSFAQLHHIGRLTFWSVNRDRPCESAKAAAEEECSGIAQQPFAFSDLVADYHG
jgi:chitinase